MEPGPRGLGLDGLTPHDLRRTFGSLARLAGADQKHIQTAMGHSSITVTAEIYAQLFDSKLNQVSDAQDVLTERPKVPCPKYAHEARSWIGSGPVIDDVNPR